MEELTLIYRRERIRFDNADGSDGMAICECERPGTQRDTFDDNSVIVKTECAEDELKTGLSYRFYGHWTTHARHGKQFVAKTFVRAKPHGEAGTLRYLCEAPNIGPLTARKLWEKFQADAMRILRDEPEVAVAAVGGQFTVEKAKAAGAWLKKEEAIEHCTIDLMELLDKRGFPKNTGKKAIQLWGNRAAEFIRDMPYRLMVLRGCGFKRCDDLYVALGLPEGSLVRQALCAMYVLARDNDGHTWFRHEEVLARVAKLIPRAELRTDWALSLLARHRDALGEWYALKENARNEGVIAERITDLAGGDVRWPSIEGLDVSDHQRGELAKTLVAPVCCFTGAPGTGKTYTVARLTAALIDAHGAESVCLMAPTGKAAARLGESLADYGVPLRPRTIHGTLGVVTRNEGEGWGFAHNEENPLQAKFYLLDEGSMPDTDIFASLLRALPAGAHLLVIGDTNQLPPVGHGSPLRDMLRAGVPAGELREIQRQAATSRIVQVCHAIKDGQAWSTSTQANPAAGENLVVAAGDAEAALGVIVDKLKRIRDADLADPVWDCQVIAAVNAKSPLARTAMNDRLQAEFNAGGQRGEGKFRTRDKIICLKNGFYPTADSDEPGVNMTADDGKVFVANGEIGRVTAIDGKVTIAAFTAPKRLVKILGAAVEEKAGNENGGEQADSSGGESEDAGGKRFDLAYAVTCHKMQGSEAKIVFVVLDEYPGARMVCGREWIYTAISRAKMVCFLVGKLDTARSMCLRKVLDRRKTFLAERLRSRITTEILSNTEAQAT